MDREQRKKDRKMVEELFFPPLPQWAIDIGEEQMTLAVVYFTLKNAEREKFSSITGDEIQRSL